jgi:hypothetical protein
MARGHISENLYGPSESLAILGANRLTFEPAVVGIFGDVAEIREQGNVAVLAHRDHQLGQLLREWGLRGNHYRGAGR